MNTLGTGNVQHEESNQQALNRLQEIKIKCMDNQSRKGMQDTDCIILRRNLTWIQRILALFSDSYASRRSKEIFDGLCTKVLGDRNMDCVQDNTAKGRLTLQYVKEKLSVLNEKSVSPLLKVSVGDAPQSSMGLTFGSHDAAANLEDIEKEVAEHLRKQEVKTESSNEPQEPQEKGAAKSKKEQSDKSKYLFQDEKLGRNQHTKTQIWKAHRRIKQAIADVDGVKEKIDEIKQQYGDACCTDMKEPLDAFETLMTVTYNVKGLCEQAHSLSKKTTKQEKTELITCFQTVAEEFEKTAEKAKQALKKVQQELAQEQIRMQKIQPGSKKEKGKNEPQEMKIVVAPRNQKGFSAVAQSLREEFNQKTFKANLSALNAAMEPIAMTVMRGDGASADNRQKVEREIRGAIDIWKIFCQRTQNSVRQMEESEQKNQLNTILKQLSSHIDSTQTGELNLVNTAVEAAQRISEVIQRNGVRKLPIRYSYSIFRGLHKQNIVASDYIKMFRLEGDSVVVFPSINIQNIFSVLGSFIQAAQKGEMGEVIKHSTPYDPKVVRNVQKLATSCKESNAAFQKIVNGLQGPKGLEKDLCDVTKLLAATMNIMTDLVELAALVEQAQTA